MKTITKIMLALALALPLTAAADDPFVTWSKTNSSSTITASDMPCINRDLVTLGYQFIIVASIPASRLQNQSDAYFIENGMAVTVKGCWSPRMHKAFWHRKHDGKEWETGFVVDNTWYRAEHEVKEEEPASVMPYKPVQEQVVSNPVQLAVLPQSNVQEELEDLNRLEVADAVDDEWVFKSSSYNSDFKAYLIPAVIMLVLGGLYAITRKSSDIPAGSVKNNEPDTETVLEISDGAIKQKQTIIVYPAKNVGISMILTFLFGPVGMLYSTIAGGLIMIVVSLIVAFATMGFGLIITWPVCIVWGAVAASSDNKRMIG